MTSEWTFERGVKFLSHDLIVRAVSSSRNAQVARYAPKLRSSCQPLWRLKPESQGLNCPRCSAGMRKSVFRRVDFQQCAACFGLWLERDQKQELQSLLGSEVIDPGQPDGSTPPPRLDRAPCPKCGGGHLIHLTDPDRPEARQESCAICGGTFFDAGEFRKLKAPGFWDRLLGRRTGRSAAPSKAMAHSSR